MNNTSPVTRCAGVQRRWFIVGLVALGAAVLAPAAHAKTHLRISVNAAAMDAFNNWTGAGSYADIANFKNGNASRPVVDLVLELQALKAGGLDFDFELVRELTYELAKQSVIDGRADLTAETIWDSEIAENAATLLHTDPILKNGDFVKGIYVLATNEKLLKLTSRADLAEATATVVSSWGLDVKTVESLSPKAIHKVATPELAYMAIKRGEADFVLDEFSSQPDLRVQRGGVTLVPVPGYTVAILGSRSWIVSKKTADADAVLKALVAGAKVLRDNGTIQRAYTESGFFNPKVASWKPLM